MKPKPINRPIPPSLHELDSYMAYRAAAEGLQWGISLAILQDCYERGVRNFFGVSLNHAKLLDDEQQPNLFHAWRTRNIN